MTSSEWLTLGVASWGALLATYHWWVEWERRRRGLALWTYWIDGFTVHVQNQGIRPILIREISVQGRFYAGIRRFLIRVPDEELHISIPLTAEGTPLLLQPNEVATQSFPEIWEPVADNEQDRRARLYAQGLGDHELLSIRYLVAIYTDGTGRTHTSPPYDLRSQSAPVYDGSTYVQGSFVFKTSLRLPMAYGVRKTPWFVRALSFRAWYRKRATKMRERETWTTILRQDNVEALVWSVSEHVVQRLDFGIG